jgi:activating signal cointegrator complex subunit 1
VFNVTALHQRQSSSDPTPLSAYGASLLASNPPIDGLDAIVVTKPERLHLTLGVMSLASRHATTATSGPSRNPISEDSHTVSSALELLRSLINLRNETEGERLPASIEFSHLDIMKPPRGVKGKGDAHVLWTGPDVNSTDPEFLRLQAVCSRCRNNSCFSVF